MAHTFPVNCDVDKAFSLLSDPFFINARNLAIGELESDCKVEQQGDKTVLYITRRIARDGVPKALTKILKPVQTVEFVEEWHKEGDTMVGHYKSDIVGMPVVVNAELKLIPTPNGCEYFIDHTAKAKIPLVGRLVEKFIISQTGDGVGAEIDYMNKQFS
jgi:hypothetical protein